MSSIILPLLVTYVPSLSLFFQPQNGTAPLHTAALCNLRPLLKLLIASGADLNLKHIKREACTAAHLAASIGNTKCLYMLLTAGADINAKTKKGKTIMDWAITHNQTACVQVLMSFLHAEKTGTVLMKPELAELESPTAADAANKGWHSISAVQNLELRASTAEQKAAEMEQKLREAEDAVRKFKAAQAAAPQSSPTSLSFSSSTSSLPPPPSMLAPPPGMPVASSSSTLPQPSPTKMNDVLAQIRNLNKMTLLRPATASAVPSTPGSKPRAVPYKSPTPLGILNEIKSGVNLRHVDASSVQSQKSMSRLPAEVNLLNDLKRTLKSKRRHVRNDSVMSESDWDGPVTKGTVIESTPARSASVCTIPSAALEAVQMNSKRSDSICSESETRSSSGASGNSNGTMSELLDNIAALDLNSCENAENIAPATPSILV